MNTSAVSEPSGKKPNHHFIKRFVLLFLIPLGALITGLFFYLHGGRYVETDNAYVKADMIPISSEVSGLANSINVIENQKVTKGQRLFSLDPEPYEISVEQAKANLSQSRTDLKTLKASYATKQAEIALSEVKYKFAIKQKQRYLNLKKQGNVSAAQFDDAQQEYQTTKKTLSQQKKDLFRIRQSLGGNLDIPIEQHPSYLAALSALKQAELNLQHTVIRAPQAGTVTHLPKTGQYMSTGQSALMLISDKSHWIEANLTETQLTRVKLDQQVDIHIDAYPDTTWHGYVTSINPTTGAEMSLLPAQNVTGNWVKIVQRVTVRIRFSDKDKIEKLQDGLSAITQIDTRYHRSLFGLSL